MKAILAFWAAAAAIAAQSASTPDAYGPISTTRISNHVKMLSSDEFEGRAPGTEGETRTVHYLIDHFKKLGLSPGGIGGEWTQPLELDRIEVQGPVSLTLHRAGNAVPLAQGKELVVNTRSPQSLIAVELAPIIFVGYGVYAPELGWNDLKDADLKGKIVLLMRGAPPVDLFKRKEGAKHQFTRQKSREIERRGAFGLMEVNPDGDATEWSVRVNSAQAAQYQLRGSRAGRPFLVSGFFNGDALAQMYAAAGLDLGKLAQAAATPDFRPAELPNAGLGIRFATSVERVVTHNVLGRVPGTRFPAETILYTAHWDHLGRGKPDASGDDIYNGAIDNASGLAVLLELARAFGKAPKPERSIVFLATTAEELGLWGANYYAENPVHPLATTVAVINIDTVSLLGPTRVVQVMGYGKTSMDDNEVARAAARQGRTVHKEKNFGGLNYNRSDHAILAREGVPALYLGWGADRIDPAPFDRDAFMTRRYHQPSDEWGPSLDFRGAAQNAELLYEIGRELANSRTWPQWSADAEYKDVRDGTADARR